MDSYASCMDPDSRVETANKTFKSHYLFEHNYVICSIDPLHDDVKTKINQVRFALWDLLTGILTFKVKMAGLSRYYRSADSL